MSLPEFDLHYLRDRQFPHEITEEGGMTCLVLPGWQLPEGLNRQAADLLIRLPALYPDVAPDMWWFEPDVQTASGGTIPATEVREMHLGRTWQRWSRHLQPDQWRSGIDGLENYLALIQHELQRAAGGVA